MQASNSFVVRSLAWSFLALGLAGCVILGDPDGAGGDDSAGGAGQGGDAGTGANAANGGAGGAGGSVDVALVKEWALQVSLGTEFGGGNTVVRWTHPPTLSIIEGTAEGSALIDEVVPTLSAFMPETPINLIAEGDTSADIDVYFIDLAAFDAVGAAHGFPIVAGNWGYFYMFWDEQGALTESYVLIATDLLFGDDLRHFTYEETTQSLGLATDSAIFDDSIFFADGSDGGSALGLSGLDERLLRLLYTHGEPGDDEAAFGAKFDAFFFE